MLKLNLIFAVYQNILPAILAIIFLSKKVNNVLHFWNHENNLSLTG